MRGSVLKLLSIILLSLPLVKKTLAVKMEDAFGVTKYAFKCCNNIYKKHYIYSAAKSLCDNKKVGKDGKFEQSIDHSLPWVKGIYLNRKAYPKEPFFVMPLFNDGTVYPVELPPERRVVTNPRGINFKITPGTDHLIIDNECNIVGAYMDRGDRFGESYRYQVCRVIREPNDILGPSESQRLASENSDTSCLHM
ncbi:hypothetical protein HI914_05429 [Erysiphe necator]|nr:hypothetical protein HI914_05429 [Erysiphe necator]